MTNPNDPPGYDASEDVETSDLVTDHEQFAGEEIPDPWDDDEQPDWPSIEAP